MEGITLKLQGKGFIRLTVIIMFFVSCTSVHNYKNGDGPRNGEKRKMILFTFKPEEYGYSQDDIAAVFFTCHLNKFSQYEGNSEYAELNKIVTGHKYKIWFAGKKESLILPKIMNYNKKNNRYEVMLKLPDGILIYAFNPLFRKGGVGFGSVLINDVNNVYVYGGFGKTTAVYIKDGKLDRIYNKKIYKKKYNLKKVRRKTVFGDDELLKPIRKILLK